MTAWTRLQSAFGRAGTFALAAGASLALTQAAWAEELTIQGAPRDGQLGFQPPASDVMMKLENFHNHMLLPIITAIAVFVLLLLLIVMVRFNARANPVPSKTSHNTLVEVVWTVVPVVILVVIAVYSFRLLFFEARIPTPDLTIKAIGKQWFWSYEYPDQGNFTFDATMVQEGDLKPGQPRLLQADNAVVVPVNKVVRVEVTAADVIHAWAVPAFGVKIDAVPGRLNETWFKATREGIYYGQCSELCGKDHAFMPIMVHVVSEQAFAAWIEEAKKQFAGGEPTDSPVQVASLPTADAAR